MGTDWDQQINNANLFSNNLKTTVCEVFSLQQKIFVESFEISSYLLDSQRASRSALRPKFEEKKKEFNIHELFANKTSKHPSK